MGWLEILLMGVLALVFLPPALLNKGAFTVLSFLSALWRGVPDLWARPATCLGRKCKNISGDYLSINSWSIIN